MNGALKGVTLVPLTGLIPLGFALLASFMRLEPVAVRADGARQATGPSR